MDESIKIWNVLDSSCLKSFKLYSQYIKCLFKIKGNQLAGGSSRNEVKIWDLENGNCIKTLIRYEFSVLVFMKLYLDKINYTKREIIDLFMGFLDHNNKACFTSFDLENIITCMIKLNDKQIVIGCNNKI